MQPSGISRRLFVSCGVLPQDGGASLLSCGFLPQVGRVMPLSLTGWVSDEGVVVLSLTGVVRDDASGGGEGDAFGEGRRATACRGRRPCLLAVSVTEDEQPLLFILRDRNRRADSFGVRFPELPAGTDITRSNRSGWNKYIYFKVISSLVSIYPSQVASYDVFWKPYPYRRRLVSTQPSLTAFYGICRKPYPYRRYLVSIYPSQIVFYDVFWKPLPSKSLLVSTFPF